MLGVWVTLTLAVVACGKSSHRPHPRVMGGEAGELAAGSPAVGGATARGGGTQGGVGQAGLDAVGGSGTAGSPEIHDPRFVLIEPPTAPSQVKLSAGVIALQPSDVIASFPEDLSVSDDGSVVVGTWTYVFRSVGSTTGAFGQAFRWTEKTGSVTLIEPPDGVPSKPSRSLGMSRDGSVVFARIEEEAGSGHACRWTAAQGCLQLGDQQLNVFADTCIDSPSRCSNNSGESLVVITGPLFAMARWSATKGWEQLPALPIDVDDAGNVLLKGEQGLALWLASGAVLPLALPVGFGTCQARLSASGTLLAGGCTANDDHMSAFRWPSPQMVEPWNGLVEVGNIAPDGSSAVGLGVMQDAVGSHRVVQYWDEEDGVVTVEDPGAGGFAVANQTLSRDGQGLFGGVLLNPELVECFRWSKTDGRHKLNPPSFHLMQPTADSSDTSVIGGNASLPGEVYRATIWDDLGPRFVDDELRALGIALGVLSLEGVFFVEKLDSEVRVLGTLRTAPNSTDEHEKQAGALYLAHLPLR